MEFSALTIGLAGAFLGALALWLFAWRNEAKVGSPAAMDSLKAQIESLHSQVGSLEQERTTLLNRISSAESSGFGGGPNPLEPELVAARRALEIAQAELAAAKSAPAALIGGGAPTEEHQNQIRALMDQLSEAHGLAAAAQQSLAEKEAWVATQKEQWLEAAKTKWIAERETEEASAAEAKFSPLLSAANEEVESVKSRLAELESTNIRLQSERSELEGQVQSLLSAKQDSEKLVSQLQTQQGDLNAEISALRQATREADSYVSRIAELESANQSLSEAKRELESQLQLAKQEATVTAQSMTNSHQARVTELEETVQMLREVNASRVDPLEVETMRRNLEDQLAEAKQAVGDMVPKSALDELNAQHEKQLESARQTDPDELSALRAGFEKERQALAQQKESELAKFDGFVDPKEVEAMRLDWSREREALTNELTTAKTQTPNGEAEEELARLKVAHEALQNQFREQEHRFVASRDQSERIAELESQLAAAKSAPADDERQTLRALQNALSERDSANARLSEMEAERAQLQRLLVLAREVSEENDALKAKLSGGATGTDSGDDRVASLESQLRIAQNEASAARAMVADMSEELTRLREGGAPDPRRFGGDLG